MSPYDFKQFFEKTNRIAHLTAFKIVKNSTIAEDVVADCYAKIYTHPLNIKNEEHLTRVLVTSVRNAAFNALSEARKISDVDNYDSLFDQNPGDEIEVNRDELISAIRREVEKLPALTRQVFELYYFENMTIEQIAARLNLSYTSVFTYKARAKKILRNLLHFENFLSNIELYPTENTVSHNVQIKTDEINAELIKYLARHPSQMRDLSPYKFEDLVAELLRDMGYDVYKTPKTRDGGRDIIAVITIPPNKQIVTLVECKNWTASRKIQPEQVKSFLYTMNDQDKANFGMMATTSFFSAGAQELQKMHKWKLSLYDFDKMNEWLINYGQWHKSSGIWLPNSPFH